MTESKDEQRGDATITGTDLHRPAVLLAAPGNVNVLLVNPGSRDVQAVARQLGATPAAASAARVSALAEVRVTFLRGSPPTDAATIDWDSIGGHTCELSVRRGSGPVPFLHALIRLSAIGSGVLPLRAAAAAFEGRAILLTGAAGSGKTSLLLALLEMGWSLVGGEWVFVSNAAVLPTGGAVSLRAQHIRKLSRLHPRMRPASLVRWHVVRGARALAEGRARAGRWSARAGAVANRLDRFELTAGDLGAPRLPSASHPQIARLIWSVRVPVAGQARRSALEPLLDELVASQLPSYEALRRLHDRSVAGGSAPSALLTTLDAVLRQRMRENLADVPVEVIEHANSLSLSELGRLALGENG